MCYALGYTVQYGILIKLWGLVMYSVCQELTEIEQNKQQLVIKEMQVKEMRKYQIGTLAEQCGILALSDETLYHVFMDLATNHYQKQV